MDIIIREKVLLPVPPAEAYDFLLSTDAFEMFDGFGPVPGIERVIWEAPNDQVGAEATVHSSDGGTHHERVVVADRPHLYVIDIWGFSSALRFLTTGARESWTLEANAQGTSAVREFTFKVRSPLLYPVVRIVGLAFRKAMKANHANFLEHFAKR
ncbi:MAG: hypothetical protein ACI9KE_002894 [Polyangiales bacterium]|jgi:hypothetical protein